MPSVPPLLPRLKTLAKAEYVIRATNKSRTDVCPTMCHTKEVFVYDGLRATQSPVLALKKFKMVPTLYFGLPDTMHIGRPQ